MCTLLQGKLNDATAPENDKILPTRGPEEIGFFFWLRGSLDRHFLGRFPGLVFFSVSFGLFVRMFGVFLCGLVGGVVTVVLTLDQERCL